MCDESLVNDNLKLAKYVANKFINRGIEYEELESMAFEGLVRAANNFDEKRGFCFSTFAVSCMCNAIKSELKKKRIRAQSLYEPLEDGRSILETIPDKQDIYDDIAIKDTLRKAMERLNEKESSVIRLLYLSNPHYTQMQAAEILGVSQAEVSRKKKKALKKIKEFLKENSWWNTIST